MIVDRGTRVWVPRWTFRADATKLEPGWVRRKVGALGAPTLPAWITELQLDVPVAAPTPR